MTRPEDSAATDLDPEDLARLRAFARAITRGTRLDAEDVVADTLSIALRSNARPSTPGAFGPWLRGIARNVVRNGARSDQRRSARERTSARGESEDDDPARRAIASEESATLKEALRGLSPAARRVVERHYLLGEALEAIARGSGEPSGTIRSRLQRGLHALRAALDRDDFRRRSYAALGLFAAAAVSLLVVLPSLPLAPRPDREAPSKVRALPKLPRSPFPSSLVEAVSDRENLPRKRRAPAPVEPTSGGPERIERQPHDDVATSR